jgi:carbon monoxide dehydrogenase subunit G
VRLENSFEVAAPVEEAWLLLNDIPRVVTCMPGAELTETIDADNWRGVVHVRLGPMALQFGTDVTREAADESAHRVALVTKARELRGRGSAQATIESSLREAEGKTNVEIVTELSLQGAVAQYGRGIVPQVAAQLTKQFAANLAALLEPEPESREGAGSPPPVEPVGGVRLGLRALWASLVRRFRRS